MWLLKVSSGTEFFHMTQIKRSLKAILNACANSEVFTAVFKWRVCSFKTQNKAQRTEEYPRLSSICVSLRHRVWCSGGGAVRFTQTPKRKTNRCQKPVLECQSRFRSLCQWLTILDLLLKRLSELFRICSFNKIRYAQYIKCLERSDGEIPISPPDKKTKILCNDIL